MAIKIEDLSPELLLRLDKWKEYIRGELLAEPISLIEEDIESLGFKSLGAGWYSDDFDIRIRIWKDNEYDIYTDLHHKCQDEHIYEYRVFSGRLYNKEELIKVLEQTTQWQKKH